MKWWNSSKEVTLTIDNVTKVVITNIRGNFVAMLLQALNTGLWGVVIDNLVRSWQQTIDAQFSQLNLFLSQTLRELQMLSPCQCQLSYLFSVPSCCLLQDFCIKLKVESKVLVYSNSYSLTLSWELAAIIAEFYSATKSFNLDVSFLNFSWSRVTVASGQTISKVGKRETKSKTIRGGVDIGL